MWKQLKKWLLTQSSSHLGIDIGSGSIKIVEISYKSGKPVLVAAGIVSLSDYVIRDGIIEDEAALTETVRGLLATMNIGTKEVTVGLGGRTVYSREITMPNMNKKEMSEAIKWDVDGYVPYEAGSYYYDFSVVGQAGGEEVKVLLVASPKENVDKISNMIKGVGLHLSAIDFEPLAVKRSMVQADNAMVIDLGAAICQVTIFQGGSPVVARNIPIGGRHFTEAVMKVEGLDFAEGEKVKVRQKNLLQPLDFVEEVSEMHTQLKILVDDLAREIRRTFEYYRIQNKDVALERILLTGGGAKLDNLAQHLAAQVDMNVVVHKPLEVLESTVNLDKKYLQDITPQISVAIGLGLYGGGL